MRRRSALALFALFVAVALPAPRATAVAADDMPTVWPAFQKAVASNDKTAVIALMRFPVQGWDENDLGTELTEPEFLRAYAKAFTPAVKAGIAKGAPKRQDDGSYVVEWRAKGPNPRHTLIFENGDGGFRCVALATGD